MTIVPTYSRLGDSFFDLSLPLRAPHRAENRFKAATLVMQQQTGRISVKQASADFQDYTTDLSTITEVIRSLLPKDPLLQKESLPLICSSLARVEEINGLIKKHNLRIKESVWMTVVSIILLILTLGIFHYKASLQITPLDPALLQAKFTSLTHGPKGGQELTLGKIRDLPADLRKNLLDQLAITETLLAGTDLDLEPFFLALTQLPFTPYTKELLSMPLSKLLAEKEKLKAALALRENLKTLPYRDFFPGGVGNSPLYESAHALLETMKEGEAAKKESSLALYRLSGKEISPTENLSCCTFSQKEVAQIDFSSWKEQQIAFFFLSDPPAKVLPYLMSLPLEKFSSLLDQIEHPIRFFSSFLPLLPGEFYGSILEKGKKELPYLPFLELSPWNEKQELDFDKLLKIVLLYEDLRISYTYFPDALENKKPFHPAFAKCNFAKIPPLTQNLLLGGHEAKAILQQGLKEKKFSPAQTEWLLEYISRDVVSPI